MSAQNVIYEQLALRKRMFISYKKSTAGVVGRRRELTGLRWYIGYTTGVCDMSS